MSGATCDDIGLIFTPRCACAAKGSSDSSWTGYLPKKLKRKKYSLSELHFNTGRLLFEFSGLQYQYHFAAWQVFVAFANPASVPFG